MRWMDDQPKGAWGCIVGVFEILGFLLVLSWPLLLLLLNNNP